ncbi:response regulator receiver domain-containing protein [Anaerobacterium chartisolvens]|uniref:Stage 0 sporulation protein A homolog n=1 Tax=Anaerobacterium chartisolvens TaxID=1297424 RepID=A0A369BFQ4_9FIRM|nr:helix-turn-helix domain-containing protein [Anaerobacterium chartisolvens]RCX19438.1 response regulator receiver domain-containing protein [Anaerobacterium chartisolvens]
MENKFRIAVIDDEQGIIDSIVANLSAEYSVDGFLTSREGIEAIKEGNYDLLILDYFIDGMNGRQVTEKIRKIDDEIYIMLLTGRAEEVPGVETLKSMDIQMYCEKTANFEEILIMIESAVKSVEHARKEGTFGVRLKRLRKLHSINQEELGKILGVGRTAVANWETNQTEPTGENIKKLAEFFKVTTDYLLCYKANFAESPYNPKR